MITLNRRSLNQSRMITGPTIMIGHNSDLALGRALCPKGPLLGRRTRCGGEGPTVEEYVQSYVKQLNTMTNFPELVQELARGYDHLTFLSYFSDQEDADPCALVIAYLCYQAPKMFADGRGFTKITDRTLMQMLGKAP